MGLPLTIWVSENTKRVIEKEAKKDSRSVSNYCKSKILRDIEGIENISCGNWWDDPKQIRDKIKGVKNGRS